MMSENQRQEIAEVIASRYDDKVGRGASIEFAECATDELLQLGYRKPRTITTVEELDALPVRSVVLCTGNRMAMSVTKRTNDEPAGLDYFTAGNPMGYAVGEIPLPATVLYEPEATK